MSFRVESIEVVREFARSRGGRCLSGEVSDAGQKLQWCCGAGHEFEASARLLMHAGYWCPHCFPNVGDTAGWDYDSVVDLDPLLARFHTRLRY